MEYELVPSPIRASYVGSQALNPVNAIRYAQLLYRGTFQAGGLTIANTAVERSLYDFFADNGLAESYGGAQVIADGDTNTRLLFPPRFFQLGDIVRTTLVGEILNNVAGVTLQFTQYGWRSEANELIRLIHRTNSTVEANDLIGLLQMTWYLTFTRQAPSVDPNFHGTYHVGVGIYTNNNTPEQMSVLPTLSDNNTFVSTLYDVTTHLRHTVQWSAATTNAFVPYLLIVDKL